MQDAFDTHTSRSMTPSEDCFAIAPSDTNDLAHATKAIYVGEGGNVMVRSVRGQADVTFLNVPSGAILDVRLRAVRQTGTTAASIVGLG